MRKAGVINRGLLLRIDFFQMTLTDEHFLRYHHHIRICLLKTVSPLHAIRVLLLQLVHLPVQIHIVKVEGFRASQAFGNFCLLDRFFAFVTGMVPTLFGVLFL